MTTAPNAFGIDDEFGVGGIGLAPDGASGASSTPQAPPFTNAANARDLFRAILGSKWVYGYANSTALTASKAVNRQDGQEVRKLDDYTSWIWKAADTTAADANHIAPTDVLSGPGRWVSSTFINEATFANATDSTAGLMSAADKTKLDSGYVIQKLTVDVPLATIQAQTTGVAFNVGAALPTNARLHGADINVLTALSGGSAASATASLQGGSDAAGSIIAATSVFTGASPVIAVTGSNPYSNRSAQQLKMTITGDGTHALSTLTAGHLSVDIYYGVAADAL
jgi:hypothetical protein